MSHSHATMESLEARLDWLRESPSESGRLNRIVVRPSGNQRVSLATCEVSPEGGVHGDNWVSDCYRRLGDGRSDPAVQVTMINSRLMSLLSPDEAQQLLAGDQLHADFDLSERNLPVGQHLAIGTARFEVSPEPHTGCGKFSQRFGKEALRFVNTPTGRALRLRGVYLTNVVAGTIAVGDVIRKV